MGPTIGKDPTWLKKEGIFFHKYECILLKMIGSSGYVKQIPLPSLSLLEWPSVDDSSVSSFHYKLFLEMQLGMKKKGGIHACSGIFMPFSIFVHIFGKDGSIRKTGKMYSTSRPSDELLTILFFTGWDRRLHDQSGEEIK